MLSLGVPEGGSQASHTCMERKGLFTPCEEKDEENALE